MSTATPIVGQPSIPTPTDDPRSLVQSILAIKANIEFGHGYPHTTPLAAPTTVNTAIGAALRAVAKTLP